MAQKEYLKIMEQAAEAEKEKILKTISKGYENHSHSFRHFIMAKPENPLNYENLTINEVYKSLGILELRTRINVFPFKSKNYLQSARNSLEVLIQQISDKEIKEHTNTLIQEISDYLEELNSLEKSLLERQRKRYPEKDY